jgi:hypothetical protein
MGVPCRLYFRVNMNALVKLLGEAGEELPFSQDGGNAHPGMAEPDPPACPKTPNKDVQTEQAIEEDREYYTRDYNRESVSQATTQRGKSSSTSHAGRGTGRRGTEASRKSNNLERALEKLKEALPVGETGTQLTGTALIGLWWLGCGVTIREMARRLGRSPSTIAEELK